MVVAVVTVDKTGQVLGRTVSVDVGVGSESQRTDCGRLLPLVVYATLSSPREIEMKSECEGPNVEA